MRLALVGVCALGCGRLGFDPIAPHDLSYDTKTGILVFNDRAPDKTPRVELVPRVFGLATSFSIAPDITALTGLAFDPATGGISGQPSRITPFTTYTVTAESELGSTTATFSLRTHPGFAVTSQADAGDPDLGDDDCDVGGTCTLRAAIEQLNVFDPTNRVVVIPPGIVPIEAGELTPTTPMEIIGSGRDRTILDAGKTSRIFHLGIEGSVAISDLATVNGEDAGDGGCILAVGGTVTLSRLDVQGCTVNGDAVSGGGVQVTSEFGMYVVNLVISGCTLKDNAAIGATRAEGGGLTVSAGRAGSSVQIVDTTFEGNSVSAGEVFGAAILVNGGEIELASSLFVANTGSAAWANQTGTTATFVNNTFTGNVDGAIHTNNDTVLTLINNTIAGNRCDTCFGGVAIQVNTGGTVTIENTILADNTEAGAPASCLGNVVTNGFNLVDTPDPCFAAAGSDRLGIDPLLGPLQDNGGPTRTLAIADGSPALDAAPACPASDQRGEARPARAGCDIGAFELQ